jgi:hypothetical protein
MSSLQPNQPNQLNQPNQNKQNIEYTNNPPTNNTNQVNFLYYVFSISSFIVAMVLFFRCRKYPSGVHSSVAVTVSEFLLACCCSPFYVIYILVNYGTCPSILKLDTINIPIKSV